MKLDARGLCEIARALEAVLDDERRALARWIKVDLAILVSQQNLGDRLLLKHPGFLSIIFFKRHFSTLASRKFAASLASRLFLDLISFIKQFCLKCHYFSFSLLLFSFPSPPPFLNMDPKQVLATS